MSSKGLTGNTLVVVVAAFLAAFGNAAFFGGVLRTYPIGAGNALPLLSLVAVSGGAIVLVLALLAFGRAAKPVLIAVLLASALCAYFMDSFGIVVNDEMLRNVAHTDMAEARDLLSLKLLAYVALLGVAPAVVVARSRLLWRGMRIELFARARLVGGTLLLMAGLSLAFGGFYASFIREHKELRSYANPTYPLYAAIKYAKARLRPPAAHAVTAVGSDARIPASDTHRELVFLVVGETARADRFSLNGYHRDTNPELARAGAISFSNFWACGTSTAVSVPCIFAPDSDVGSSPGRASASENLLDVLQHAGVNVLWLDNNSDSKGVALRVPYRNFRSPDTNPVCDTECRDEGMLAGLQAYIDAHPKGDILVVLHQMGNHGPAYYKRYPREFERFRPACQNADLSQCSREEIDNAYDNAILYTDHFLGQVIGLLERNDGRFETALFYVSDHGESLGEGGVYLHGLPKAIAPRAQLHVPAVMWFGQSYDELDRSALRARRGARFTHANVFHTVLGFMEIESSVYRAELDMLEGSRTHLAKASPGR
jgi:lipid A ethanolaminephosphotransferase